MNAFLSLAVVISGTYMMEIDINGRIFNDRLEIHGSKGPMTLIGTDKIRGTLEVPGVFSSPLSGSYSCLPWINECHIEFEITAVEQGQEYKVYYVAHLNRGAYVETRMGRPAVLTGEAYLENRELLGNFKAEQIP